MTTFCLEMRSTADWQDVRYREYTSSKRKADLFKQVPKIRFTEAKRPTKVHGDVIEALTQAQEYFEDRADVVDGSYGEPSPNREMSLAQLCKDALSRVALNIHKRPE
jgi:hypothetical protein